MRERTLSMHTIRVHNFITYLVIHRYNLQSLVDKDLTVTNTNGSLYKFKVCGTLKNTTCKAGTGITLYQSFRKRVALFATYRIYHDYLNSPKYNLFIILG